MLWRGIAPHLPVVLGPGLDAVVDDDVGPESVHGQLLRQARIQVRQAGLHACKYGLTPTCPSSSTSCYISSTLSLLDAQYKGMLVKHCQSEV